MLVARAGNVIGGGDWSKDRLIPDCVRDRSYNNKKVSTEKSKVPQGPGSMYLDVHQWAT